VEAIARWIACLLSSRPTLEFALKSPLVEQLRRNQRRWNRIDPSEISDPTGRICGNILGTLSIENRRKAAARALAVKVLEVLFSGLRTGSHPGTATWLGEHIYCPGKKYQPVSVDEKRPYPMRRQDLR
jgi:hypothetical protein